MANKEQVIFIYCSLLFERDVLFPMLAMLLSLGVPCAGRCCRHHQGTNIAAAKVQSVADGDHVLDLEMFFYIL